MGKPPAIYQIFLSSARQSSPISDKTYWRGGLFCEKGVVISVFLLHLHNYKFKNYRNYG